MRIHRLLPLAFLVWWFGFLRLSLEPAAQELFAPRAIFTTPPNPEAQLAAGQPLLLKQSRLVDLELIPQVNDRRALQILENKRRIEKRAHIKPEEGCAAFEIVHGIGEKTAEFLCDWLSPG